MLKFNNSKLKPLITVKCDPIDDQFKYSPELTQPILDGIGHEMKSSFGRVFSEGDKLLTATVLVEETEETVENDIPQISLKVVTFSDKEVSKFKSEYEQDQERPAFYRKKTKIRRTIHD